MARGGARPGAGRKPGTLNKTLVERQKALDEMAAKIGAVIPGAFTGDAHEFLMAVYKNPEMPLPVRVDAAKAAVGYEKPKLQAIEHSGNEDAPVFVVSGQPTELPFDVSQWAKEARMNGHDHQET